MKKFLILTVVSMLSLGIITGCGDQGDLEASALPGVNQIIKEDLKGEAKCLRVKITEKVDGTHYKATATLNNGHDIIIMIEDRGETVLVTIPEQ